MENKVQMIIVGGMIVENNKILVAKRAQTKKFFPGCWELPAGKVEFGESPEDALKREVLEEVNINIEIGKVIHAFSYVTSKSFHDIEIVYQCFLEKDEKVKINPEDHSEFAWLSPEEAVKKLQNDVPGEADAVRKFLEEKL